MTTKELNAKLNNFQQLVYDLLFAIMAPDMKAGEELANRYAHWAIGRHDGYDKREFGVVAQAEDWK